MPARPPHFTAEPRRAAPLSQRPPGDEQASVPPKRPRPGAREMVALLAALMAMNAFAIDSMLPALPAIGDALGVSGDNRRQLVIIAYFVGFGLAQLAWGPLGDRFGRRPVLGGGIALYTGFAILCSVATSFEMLIGARIAMGASAAVTRVLVTAMVRDLFEGAEMARVMSLVFMVFILVPVVAPSVGQAILLVGDWRAIFWVLGSYGLFVGLWTAWRLPETLHPDHRASLDPRAIARAVRATLGERLSLGYTLALTAMFAALTSYIASIQQIVFDAFERPSALPLVFAAIAAPLSLASWLNSRIVGRFGVRRVSHLGLIAFTLINLAHMLVARSGPESLALFIVLMGAALAAFAFTSANFGTLAMTHMAPIAGTASSVQGLIGTIGGAAGGFFVGRAFDGTILPFTTGLAGFGLLSLAILFVTERGRLMRETGTD